MVQEVAAGMVVAVGSTVGEVLAVDLEEVIRYA